jgi:CBS-domain-containing membrane protein
MSIMILTGKTRYQSQEVLNLPSAATFFVIVSSIVVFVPMAALAMSFLMGGAAVSETLFLYLFSILWNAPLLFAGVALCAVALTVRQFVRLFSHRGERARHFDVQLQSSSGI